MADDQDFTGDAFLGFGESLEIFGGEDTAVLELPIAQMLRVVKAVISNGSVADPKDEAGDAEHEAADAWVIPDSVEKGLPKGRRWPPFFGSSFAASSETRGPEGAGMVRIGVEVKAF